MKKKNILLGILLTGAAISLASCVGNKPKNPTTNTGTTPVTTDTTPVTTTTPVDNKITLTFNTMGGDSINPMKVEKGEDIGLPTPTRSKKVVDSTTHEAIAYEFVDWYLDAEYTEIIEENKFNADTVLYARWNEIKSAEDGYDFVQAQVNLSNYGITESLSKDWSRSIFTFGSGAQGRSRTNTWTCKEFEDFEGINQFDSLVTGEKEYMFTHSFKVTGTPLAKFRARADGYVRLYVQNGSSSAKDAGVKVTVGSTNYTIKIPANYGEIGNPVVQVCVEVEKDEEYVLYSSGGTTMDIYCIEAEYIAEESDPSYISIDRVPQTNFITGQDFNYDELELDLNYENGRIDKISSTDDDLKIDVDDITSPGDYEVTVTYKDLDPINYDISVSNLSRFDIGIYEDELLLDGTSMGDLIYFNHSLKTIYKSGEALDLNYLTVNAYDEADNKYLFKYYEDDYISYEVYDSSNQKVGAEDYVFTTSGKYTVKAKLKVGTIEKENEFIVDVVDTEPVIITEDNVTRCDILVDTDYNGVIGAKVKVDGYNYNEFKTIQQALEYLEAQDDFDDIKKFIYIAPGTYREKLEITIPNLTLIGYYSDPTQVLIEWDSVYGVADASGFIQERDSSQTVAVRESAYNVTFDSITISNYYNSSARCASLKDTRALALLVQSDKFIMNNCKLLGYQDTVNFFYGRQYIKNSYIAGITDFIFGTNNTTLFDNCEIHTVGGKDNGYVTAFMGCSKGEEDKVQYGTIFSNCRFTADSDVGAGSISLGRCWGPYPAVAFLNCNMGAHISTAEADGSTAGKRYVSLAVSPLSEGTNFVEYANSGLGSVDHTIAGMTYLTEDEAANYLDVTIIFGTKNGNVEYPDIWNCFALFQ